MFDRLKDWQLFRSETISKWTKYVIRTTSLRKICYDEIDNVVSCFKMNLPSKPRKINSNAQKTRHFIKHMTWYTGEKSRKKDILVNNYDNIDLREVLRNGNLWANIIPQVKSQNKMTSYKNVNNIYSKRSQLYFHYTSKWKQIMG